MRRCRQSRLFRLLALIPACFLLRPATEAPAQVTGMDAAQVRAHALYTLAVTHLVAHRYDAALAAFVEAGRLDRDDPEPRIKAAGLLLAARKPEAALELLEQARRDFPSSPRIRVLLAAAYQQTGRAREAVEEYRAALGLGSPEASARLALSSLLFGEGEPAEARLVLEAGSETFPENPDFPLKLGASFLEEEDPEKAIPFLRRALELDPDSLPARSLLGWALDKSARPEEAIVEYEAVLRLGGSPVPEISLQLARLYVESGRYNMAAGKLRALLEEHPARTEAFALLGSVEYLRGDYEAARGALEKALAAGKPNAMTLSALGLVYEKLGLFDEAVRVLEQAIVSDPKMAGPYNDLGYFYAERGVKLDEAEELVRRALELKPDTPAFLDSLGWIYYARGDYRRALEYLEQAAALDPEEPEILGHLGDVWFRLGETETAREYWERALGAEHPDPEAIRLRLEEGLPPAPAAWIE